MLHVRGSLPGHQQFLQARAPLQIGNVGPCGHGIEVCLVRRIGTTDFFGLRKRGTVLCETVLAMRLTMVARQTESEGHQAVDLRLVDAVQTDIAKMLERDGAGRPILVAHVVRYGMLKSAFDGPAQRQRRLAYPGKISPKLIVDQIGYGPGDILAVLHMDLGLLQRAELGHRLAPQRALKRGFERDGEPLGRGDHAGLDYVEVTQTGALLEGGDFRLENCDTTVDSVIRAVGRCRGRR